jgi:hypothetical protein
LGCWQQPTAKATGGDGAESVQAAVLNACRVDAGQPKQQQLQQQLVVELAAANSESSRR